MKFSVIFLLFVILIGCSKSPVIENGAIIYQTSAEFTDGNFLTDSISFSEFKDISYRTEEYARTGKYGIKLDSTHVYGFGLTIDNPKEGELIFASVWQRKGALDGTLMCAIEGKYDKLVRSWGDNSNIDDEWFKHTLSFIVEKDVDKLSFYVFAASKVAYFDDIKIQRFPKIPELNKEQKKNELSIYIPDSSNLKLEEYIDHALTGEIITKQDKKYVNAFIVTSYDSIPIKMRLKGDWTDHLTSGKISYRIKIKGNSSFMGLKTFSIQHPRTRNYMHEWFMHKLCDKEGLLSTKYEMIPVTINGVNKGIYALEEHFDKQLLESRNRREGPILKMDESGMWAITYASNKLNKNKAYPYYKASYISFFKKKRTLKNKLLKSQMEEGAKLLTLFKNHYGKNEYLFDIENIAKYYALLELGNVHHSFAWHNRRFYYNPITELMEPIGFDMIPGEIKNNEIYVLKELNNVGGSEGFQINNMLFKNRKFKQDYMIYVAKYSDSLFINNVFKSLENEIENTESKLSNEIAGFRFNKEFYFSRAKIIRRSLKELDSVWNNYIENDIKVVDFIHDSIYYRNKDTFQIDEISLNIYVHKFDFAEYEVEIDNYHLNDVNVIGYKYSDDSIKYFEESKLLKAYLNKRFDRSIKFTVNRKPKKILYQIKNYPNRTFVKKVFKWQKPKGITTRMSLEQSFNKKSEYYLIKDSVLTFKNGNYAIDKLIYIPKKYKVVIQPKTEIDFINGGGIIANNDFTAMGNENNSIIFKSTDGNNNGITILQANKVELAYVIADSLNTLHYGNWMLTGGISIYESETEINNCIIKSNTCEDALNIIRSHFIINNLTIENTKSDGFDADFCSGSISNSQFIDTGNDCIDFSGSTVEISDIDILNSGDKGISGGERSTLTLNNIRIDGAITGIAAKDDTHINGSNIDVQNAEFGVAAFQKKAEYAKAFINLNNVTYTNLQQYGLVDLGSLVIIDGQYFYGGMQIDIDQLYARFEKK